MRFRSRHSSRPADDRHGSVALEMALVLPVFVTLIAGVSEARRLLEVQNLLTSVAHKGASLAAMDRAELLASGESTNERIEKGIKNHLTASGLPGANTSVYIVDPDDHSTPIDLDDAASYLALFELRVEMPYDAISGLHITPALNMVSKIVFRNAPPTYGR